MSDPDRQVLFLMPKDLGMINRTFRDFYMRGWK